MTRRPMTPQERLDLYQRIEKDVQMVVAESGVEAAQMFVVAAAKALALTFNEPISAVIADIADSAAVVEGTDGYREISVH